MISPNVPTRVFVAGEKFDPGKVGVHLLDNGINLGGFALCLVRGAFKTEGDMFSGSGLQLDRPS